MRQLSIDSLSVSKLELCIELNSFKPDPACEAIFFSHTFIPCILYRVIDNISLLYMCTLTSINLMVNNYH